MTQSSWSMRVFAWFCTHEIDSKPPAANISPSPAMIRCAASAMVCSPEEQKRFIDTPAVVTGQPARKRDLTRATFAPDAPSQERRADDHILDFGRIDAGALDGLLAAHGPVYATGCDMLRAPRQDLPARCGRSIR